MNIPPISPTAQVSLDEVTRRAFLRQSLTFAGSCAACLASRGLLGAAGLEAAPTLANSGDASSKARVVKLYLGTPGAHWPTPKLDLQKEIESYEQVFRSKDFTAVEFLGNKLISNRAELAGVQDFISGADGILLIHLSMGIDSVLRELLAAGKPTLLFAAPYSGHEWSGFGSLRNQPAGEKLECVLTSDKAQLANAVRPFRAIHHLRTAKLLNLSTRPLPEPFTTQVAQKFGTQIKTLGLPQMLAAYAEVDEVQAEAETRRLMKGARKIVEPPREEIHKSCRLALAFERVLAQENATALTVDCYGSMYRQLPAFPCVGFVRLNDRGLAGICESDLTSALTFLLLQGLSDRPGFISDPTMDESKGAIILAHCLGSTRMDGPSGPRAPYKLRTIMERQEGCVPQVQMRVGQKVTQAILVGTEQLNYFTGTIVESPDTNRGCRTKMTVRVDGDAEKLWQNWGHGLHRVTCYGDWRTELKRLCRYTGLKLVDEA